ncbi:MAG: hypothetical protein JWP20_1738 [Roseomonas sp.]|jgi:hypothetical protein|nr:hypothetical protein [Roseomonas sp.]
MTHQPRLNSLQDRHASLDRQLSEEGNRPAPDASTLVRLKRAKLRLKEEMEKLRANR